MTYLQEESKVLYQSKDGKMEKAFDGLEWLAAMTSHVLNRPGWLQWFQYLLSICCFRQLHRVTTGLVFNFYKHDMTC
jgi:hypothetical protein